MRSELVAQAGRYLVAVPTVALIDEWAERLREIAPRLDVTKAHHQSPGHGTVVEKVEFAMQRAEGIGHAAVLTTHETLMTLEPLRCTGWHLLIDEAPTAVQSKVVRKATTYSAAFFRQHFDLEADDRKGWWRVQPKTAPESWRAVAGDDIAKAQAAFCKHAFQESGVFVDTDCWSAKKFAWVSAWTPAPLAKRAASVVIAAASYASSIGGRVAGELVQFLHNSVPSQRNGQPQIAVHYFTATHQGSTALWARSEGRKCLRKVLDFLTSTVPNLDYWSGNEVVRIFMDHGPSGEQVAPKLAGLNRLWPAPRG